MADARFQQLVSQLAQHRADANAALAAKFEKEAADEAVREAWHGAYRAMGPPTSEDAISVTVERLVALGDVMRSLWWDFHVADMLGTPNLVIMGCPRIYCELCFRILKHACNGDRSTIASCLTEGTAVIPAVRQVHNDLLDCFRARDDDGLLATPPLSRRELSRVAGITYHKLTGDIKAKRWAPVTADAVPYKPRKRWRHTDDSIQTAVLEKIRDKFPEKLWSARDPMP